MASRKDKPTPPEKGQQPSRFTLDDIERAILGVKRAGLVVAAWKSLLLVQSKLKLGGIRKRMHQCLKLPNSKSSQLRSGFKSWSQTHAVC